MRDDLPPLELGRKFHQMAFEAQATIARLSAERDAAATKAERKHLNRRIHELRGIERFIRTRRGYADENANFVGPRKSGFNMPVTQAAQALFP